MTYHEVVARLSAIIPSCPYCGAPGRLCGESEAGATYQCQSPRCTVRGSWTVPSVIDTTGYPLSSWSVVPLQEPDWTDLAGDLEHLLELDQDDVPLLCEVAA